MCVSVLNPNSATVHGTVVVEAVVAGAPAWAAAPVNVKPGETARAVVVFGGAVASVTSVHFATVDSYGH